MIFTIGEIMDASWIESEFDDVHFGDTRLNLDFMISRYPVADPSISMSQLTLSSL